MAEQPLSIGRNYFIELKVGKVDLTIFLQRVRLINTINSIYPVIAFELNIDTDHFVFNDIFGQRPMELSISMQVGDYGEQSRTTIVEADLLYLNNTLHLTPKQESSKGPDEDRQPVSLSTIFQDNYLLMSSGVNYIAEEPCSKKPLDVLKAALQQAGVTSILANTSGMNQEDINQIIIPPMSVNRTIDFMNEKYGLYEGPLYKYCAWDSENSKPVLLLGDFNKIIQSNPLLTMYQLPSAAREESTIRDIEDKCRKDSQHFYTMLPVTTDYKGNARMMQTRYNKTQIIHPSDKLFSTIPQDLDTVMQKYGLFDETKTMKYNPALKNCETQYCWNLKGHNYTSHALTSRMASQIKDMSLVKFDISGRVKIDKLLVAAVPFLFEPATEEYMKYAGKYVIQTIDIEWSKANQDQWDCNVRISAMRSSLEK